MILDPASEIELPRLGHRLPRHVLTASEAEQVMMQPNIADPLGLRDRAILEVLYSTGIRRMELIRLKLFDLDSDRGTLLVRQGKGKKDRFVPIGERAAAWVEEYIREARLQRHAVPGEPGRSDQPRSSDPDGAQLRGAREDRQDRSVPSVPPHHGHADARRRSRYPLYPADARPRGTVHHGN